MAGYDLRATIIETLQQLGHEIVDQGAFEYLATDDYPDYAIAVGQAILAGKADRGILVCGSGVGVAITANKLPGIRACLCHDTYTAAQGVQHDDMNVLCLGGRVIGPELACVLVRAFVERQLRRRRAFSPPRRQDICVGEALNNHAQ